MHGHWTWCVIVFQPRFCSFFFCSSFLAHFLVLNFLLFLSYLNSIDISRFSNRKLSIFFINTFLSRSIPDDFLDRPKTDKNRFYRFQNRYLSIKNRIYRPAIPIDFYRFPTIIIDFIVKNQLSIYRYR